MKKSLITSAFSMSTLGISKINCETVKKNNKALQSTIKVLQSENEN